VLSKLPRWEVDYLKFVYSKGDENMYIIEDLNFDYFFDEEKRVVVARITNKIINVALTNTSDVSGLILEDIEIKDCKGVAKCRPDDVYDERLGMKIAKKKALKKVFNQIKGALRDTIDAQEKMLKCSYLSAFDLAKKLDSIDASLSHFKK
jgi:hypothetical protein